MQSVKRLLKKNHYFLFSVNGTYENCTIFTIVDNVLGKYLPKSNLRSIHYLSEEHNYRPLIIDNDFELINSWKITVPFKITAQDFSSIYWNP